jgi:hypothetical protein
MEYSKLRASILGNNWLTTLTVSIYLALLVFFALYSKLGVSPDGLDHMDFSIKGVPKINFIGPANQDFPIKYVHFYSTGYGYHFFIHLVYKALEAVSFNSINETTWVITPFLSNRELDVPAAKENALLIMRLLSVVFAFLQMWILKKICNLLELEKIFPITLIWLSFSIMFPFLHSNASRDVLINLLSMCFVYNILAFHMYRKEIYIKFMMLILAIGPFVQLSLAAFVVTVLVAYAILYKTSFYDMIKNIFKLISLKRGVLFPILLGIVAFPTIADMTNKVVQYQSIKPSCEKMFSLEECNEKNATFRIYHDFHESNSETKRIGIVDYVKKWYPGIFKRIFGIMGHQSYGTINNITHPLIAIFSILFIISTVFNIIYKHKATLFTGIISLLYFIVILFFVNRKVYMYTGVFNAALQGRYIFPVYPLMIMYAHSSIALLRNTGYYLYVFLLFSFLFFIYYLFLVSPRFAFIIVAQ